MILRLQKDARTHKHEMPICRNDGKDVYAVCTATRGFHFTQSQRTGLIVERADQQTCRYTIDASNNNYRNIKLFAKIIISATIFVIHFIKMRVLRLYVVRCMTV